MMMTMLDPSGGGEGGLKIGLRVPRGRFTYSFGTNPPFLTVNGKKEEDDYRHAKFEENASERRMKFFV